MSHSILTSMAVRFPRMARQVALKILRPELRPEPVTEIHVVLNWLEELERLVPTGTRQLGD